MQERAPLELFFIRHAESVNNLWASIRSRFFQFDKETQWTSQIPFRKPVGQMPIQKSGATIEFILKKDQEERRDHLLSLLRQEEALLRKVKEPVKDPTLSIHGSIQALALAHHPYLETHFRLWSGSDKGLPKIMVFISPSYRTLLTAEHFVKALLEKFPGRVCVLVIPSIAERGSGNTQLPFPDSALPTPEQVKENKQDYGQPVEELEKRFPDYNFEFLKNLEKSNLDRNSLVDNQTGTSLSPLRSSLQKKCGWNWWPPKLNEGYGKTEGQNYEKRVFATSLWLKSLVSQIKKRFNFVFVISHGDFLNDLLSSLLSPVSSSSLSILKKESESESKIMLSHRNASITHFSISFGDSPSKPPSSLEDKLYYGPSLLDLANGTTTEKEIQEKWKTEKDASKWILRTFASPHFV